MTAVKISNKELEAKSNVKQMTKNVSGKRFKYIINVIKIIKNYYMVTVKKTT